MRNHINARSDREPPEGVLRSLREIDPTLDLHYLGEGSWAVGSVKPNAARRELAGRMLEQISHRPDVPRWTQRHRLAELAFHGFGVIAMYSFRGEPTSQVVEDVRNRHYTYQQNREREFMRRLDEASNQAGSSERLDKTLQDIEYREKHVAPVLFRGARSVDLGRQHTRGGSHASLRTEGDRAGAVREGESRRSERVPDVRTEGTGKEKARRNGTAPGDD